MGTCYSTHSSGAQANTHHLPYIHPANMKKNGGSQHSFGFRKPYSAARHSAAYNRNSAEQVAATISEHTSHTSHLPQQGGQNVGFASRFGFRTRSDSNSNVAVSNTSTDSLSTTHSRKKCEAQSQVGTKRSLSFEPDDHDGPFLMIDDDSNSQTNDTNESKTSEYYTDSMQKRTQSSDSLIMRRKLICEDLTNANIIPVRSPSHNPSRSNVRSMQETPDTRTQAKKGGKGLQHGCPQSGPGSKKGTSKTRKFTDKIKQPFQRFSNGGTKKEKAQKSENPETTNKEKCANKRGSVISKIRTSSRSSVHTKSSSDSGTSTVKHHSASHSTENEADNDSVFLADSKTTSGYYQLEDGVRAAAPIAMIDSLETTSIGSLNSEDLMLETDICVEDYTEGYGHGDPLTGRIISRRSSQRHRSLSGERHDPKNTSLTEEKAKEMGTEGAIPKRPTSLKIEDHSTVDPQMEPLQELATLLRENEVVKRCPTSSQDRASRPSSFPGSEDTERRVAGTTRSRHHSSILKPPRQAATMEDEEAKVVMDGFTYRHLMQDLTTFKTMLLKLRRVVQEEEIGSPFGSQPWKIPNGYRLGSTGGSSQADSPHAQDADPFMSAAPLDTLKQENVELMHQLGILQQQLQEKDNTIKLLQHQMTKYECGHLGPQSKVFTNAATQTDRPRSLPISKSVFEPVSTLPQSTSAGSATCVTSVSGQTTKTYPRHQAELGGRLARKADDSSDRKTQSKHSVSGQQGMKSGKLSSAGDAREGTTAHSSTSLTEQTPPSGGLCGKRHPSKQVTRGQAKTFESGVTRRAVQCESVTDKARPTSQLRRPVTRLPKSTDVGASNCSSSAPAAVRKIPRGTSQFKSFAGIAKT